MAFCRLDYWRKLKGITSAVQLGRPHQTFLVLVSTPFCLFFDGHKDKQIVHLPNVDGKKTGVSILKKIVYLRDKNVIKFF